MSKIPQSFVMMLNNRYRVYYNPQGTGWYAAYTVNGKRERVSLGVKTRPEAEAAVRKLETPQAAIPAPLPGRILWSDIHKSYLEHKKTVGRAPKTIARCLSSLNAFARYLKTKGIKFADEITLVGLEGYFAYRTEVEKRDAISAYTDQMILKHAMKWASKATRGLMKSNPTLDWETRRPVKPRKRVYKPDEVAKLERGVRDWMRPVVITLAWTGMRIGELINLRWKDVDFEHRVIRIRVQDEWKPKGKRDRTVPIHPKVEAVLRERPLGEYVFMGPRGGRMKETRCLECLKEDQRELNLPEGELHGFRRFFATTMMQAGASAETVRQWGGWKTLETMLRYLADVDVKDSVAAMDGVVRRMAAG